MTCPPTSYSPSTVNHIGFFHFHSPGHARPRGLCSSVAFCSFQQVHSVPGSVWLASCYPHVKSTVMFIKKPGLPIQSILWYHITLFCFPHSTYGYLLFISLSLFCTLKYYPPYDQKPHVQGCILSIYNTTWHRVVVQ